MSWMQRKSLTLAVSMLGLAAVLGGSLGIAVAKHNKPTVTGVCANGSPGCNINFVGAIRAGGVSPAKFTECLPPGAWEGIYVWDGPAQEWRHFLNPAVAPDFVNSPQAGGIENIPGFAGVVLIMKAGQPSQTVTLLDANSETC